MLTNSPATFIATEVIPAGARVKFTAGQAGHAVSLAALADTEIGTALLHNGKSSYAIGEGVGVALSGCTPGSVTCIALGTVTVLDVVKRAAAGKVAADGAGSNYGIALESSTAGKFVEVLPLTLGNFAGTAVVIGSTNGTFAAAADLAAVKVEGEKVGDDVRAIYAALVAQGILS